MKPAQSAKTRKGVESTLRTSKAKYEQSGGLYWWQYAKYKRKLKCLLTSLDNMCGW